MTRASIRIAAIPADDDTVLPLDRSVTVRTAALYLGADESTVRKLLRRGELQGHRLGSRGVRIYASSIDAYRRRQAIGSTKAPEARRRRPATITAEHREAVAALRDMGIL